MTTAYSTVPRPATVSVAEAARLLGVGRSLAYELAPGVPVVRVGERRYRVPVRPLAEVLGLTEHELLERLGRGGTGDA
jgi:hypothetical protein